LLDLVKHAVKTVIKTMRSTDRVALILFNNKTDVAFKFTTLTEQNREKILTFVDQIQEKGETNIHVCLISGMDLINVRRVGMKFGKELSDAAIMFFTDGSANRGRFQSSEAIVKSLVHKNFYYPIHTFAFGQYKSCVSKLLLQISKNFNGMFGYIQDAKTVGTIFISGIAYTLCTAISAIRLQVTFNG
jgi:hypothetical protein